MNSSFIGKTCPYCQYPIKHDSEVAVCATCHLPHHQECWQQNLDVNLKEPGFMRASRKLYNIAVKVAVVVLFFLVVPLVVYYFLLALNPVEFKQSEHLRGNTVGNNVNGGIAAIEGHWIFYHNYDDDERVYRIRTDGSGVAAVFN